MPSTVVHAAVAFLLAVGLLGEFYDRRALGVVLVVMVAPELDTFAGWFLEGAHRALLHNLVFTAVAVAVVWWDTTRESSWLRRRFGARGVRLVWVGLFVHTFAHMLFDWSHLDGINLFYPITDRFFNLDGEAFVSTAKGFSQTFIEVTTDAETGQQSIDAGQGGTTQNTHVSSPVDPSPDSEPEAVDRRAPIAVQGWQLYLIALGAFTLVAKKLQSPAPSDGDDA
jgi:hypothetical protein